MALRLTAAEILAELPHDHPRDIQSLGAERIAAGVGAIEAPTGTGKTALGFAVLTAHRKRGVSGPLFYVTPTKAQVDQVVRLYPGTNPVYGRQEHPCLYYRDRGEEVNAHDAPCATICAAKACPHEIHPDTGETRESGAEPCPYFQQKFGAKHGNDVVVCTTAFYLTSMVYARDWEAPAFVVIDEAHRTAQVARGIFRHEITDYHLRRCIAVLRKLGDRENAVVLKRFLDAFRRMARRKPSPQATLLRSEDTAELLAVLEDAKPDRFPRLVRDAIDRGTLDLVENRTIVKLVEDLTRNVRRYAHGLEFALADDERNALNFIFAYYHAGDLGQKKARYHLVIAWYYVAPLIRKVIGRRALAMSATIGNPETFAFETGITLPFASLPSTFPPGNARIFIPTDTPDLAKRARGHHDLRNALDAIIAAAKRFAGNGHRSLVVVISDAERTKFLERATAAGLNVVSYGNGRTARDAAAAFGRGEGDVLLGTAAHYAEGIDLPRQTAPVIFFLRPGYARPDDPQTQFEERRFSGGKAWALWHWRVMLEALQVRGRNIRGATDLGVCFFISQQFRRVIGRAFPEWLRERPVYVGVKTFAAGIEEALNLLGRRNAPNPTVPKPTARGEFAV